MNKYVAMMREQEYVGYRLAEHGQGSSTRAHGDKCATDWRAMREAWEAREKLLTVYYGSHNAKFGPCECGACSEYRKARVT